MKKQLVLLLAFLLVASELAAAQQGSGATERREVQFQWYWLIGKTVGECNGNCMGACLPACYAAAAGAGISGGECSSSCSPTCNTRCRVAISARNWNLPNLYESRAPERYSKPDVPETTTDALPVLPPDVAGQIPAMTGGETPQVPTITEPPVAPAAGVHEEVPNCPAFAPDGHPVAYDPILGCYDTHWRADYCGHGQTCNACAGLQGCIWTGAACVPCTSPTCIFTCPSGTQAQANPAQMPAPAAIPTLKPTPGAAATPIATTTPGGQPTTVPGGQPTITPGGQPTVVPGGAQPTPTPEPTATPVPISCRDFNNCNTCTVSTTQKNLSCGWSEFFGKCVNLQELLLARNYGMKSGWLTDSNSCKNVEKGPACNAIKDCFSCTGIGGVKRECQWSVQDARCEGYNEEGDFRNVQNPNGNDIVLPDLCPVANCSQYTKCTECAQNAVCVWSTEQNQCNPYYQGGQGIYYPRWCPAESNVTIVKPGKPSCPSNCTCDEQTRVTDCQGKWYGGSNFVPSKRALVNAEAGGKPLNVTSIQIREDGGNYLYEVKGTRPAIFFFIWPVDLEVKTTVNAQTGEVKSVEEPWWAFLTG